MKLEVSFESLWAQVARMGAERSAFELEQLIRDWEEIDASLSDEGIEVQLEELDTTGGLLSYHGRQVLLYIPDQGWRISDVLDNGAIGKKFHVSHCKTLVQMREDGRFERYVATNDLSGDFKVHGVDNYSRHEIEGIANLNVCKNCLSKLNYKGSIDWQVRQSVCNDFSISEFFETYSTIFPYMPKQLDKSNRQLGYTPDWADISARQRKKHKYICQDCKVDLSENKRLVHVHHINGQRADNRESNLRVLCAACHKQQPYHSHVYIRKNDMQLITRVRNAQRLQPSGWDEVLKYADSSLHGILGMLRERGVSPPEIGFEFADSRGAVTAEVEAAWPRKKQGIVLTASDKPQEPGWYFFTLEQVIEDPYLIH